MATAEEYIRPLRAFRHRYAFGNVAGDFMVPFGTALFNTSRITKAAMDGATGAETRHRVATWGFLDDASMSSLVRADSAGGDVQPTHEGIVWMHRVPAEPHAGASTTTKSAEGGRKGLNVDTEAQQAIPEVLMARSLDACGWTKVWRNTCVM